MVTATQVSRLDAKLGALVAAIDTDNQPITVMVFRRETREFSLQRHRELRTDHAAGWCGSSIATCRAPGWPRCSPFTPLTS